MVKTSKDRAKELVQEMTLAEKVSLCSGEDCWNTKAIPRLEIESIMVSDGPHGLRKQKDSQDNLGIGESIPATCFPTASLTACSFDPDLIYEMGEAIACECRKEGVSVILGPGINMKRNPLCGRNFEYFSEDPFLTAKLAVGYVRGVQSKGIGCSLKHFAVNNQERRRMNVDAVVDQRALHEIYLRAFEKVVKEANPRSVMCSYNKLNEVYASENKELLTDILRDKWGYQGLVISDWGAVHDRVAGIRAGLDLEMPGNGCINDKKIENAVLSGELEEGLVDRAAERVTELILSCGNEKTAVTETVQERNHQLAIKIAAESMVLLKNEKNCLPLTQETDEPVAIVGEFAVKPRFQGTGSSKICPIKIDSPLEELKKAGMTCEYSSGDHLEETLELCRARKRVIVFAGLPETSESEGVDRKHMKLPQAQNDLICAIAQENPNVCVVLMGGTPVELPWEEKVQAILLAYLGGEGAGTAIARILTGKQNPCGKLAESWPMKYEDVPGHAYFPGDRLHVLYPESIFIGYRYYDSVGIKPRYCFGHGLTYSEFEYSNLRIEKPSITGGEKAVIRFCVKNVGLFAGKEISYVFMSHYNEQVYMPKHQLVGFCKSELQPLEEKEMMVEVNPCDFAYYNTVLQKFCIDSGEYELAVGASLQKLPLTVKLNILSEEAKQPSNRKQAEVYFQMAYQERGLNDECKPANTGMIQQAGGYFDDETGILQSFEAILGYKLPDKALPAAKPYTEENCLEDVGQSAFGRFLLKIVDIYLARISKKEENQEQMMEAAIKEMPLFAIAVSSNGLIPEKRLKRLLWLINKF